MIRAYHLILAAYGFWLPNDPRGSWSDFVRQEELGRFGPATKVQTAQSLAHRPHDHAARKTAKAALRHSPVRFTGQQAREIGRAFATVFDRTVCPAHACAILPDHVHMVIGRTRISVEQTARQLKQVATQRLRQAGLDPTEGVASPWSRKCWKVFLNTDEQVHMAIEYVRQNPVREGLPAQDWSFVTPYPFV